MNKQSIEEIRHAVTYMAPFFDMVRVVDTAETKVIDYSLQGKRDEAHTTCYKIWNKEKRCAHCTSMQALLTGEQKEKYEFKENEVYHVVSRPVQVVDEKGNACQLVLEIVNGVSDVSLFEKFGVYKGDNKTIIDLIAETYQKIYEDTLTHVYNRRYLEEYHFLYREKKKLSNEVGFIMADLKKFKIINDTMGHEAGDRVLVEVATVFKKNIGSKDSVIRIGGDEFLIVLVDCLEEEVISKIELLNNEVRKIRLSEESLEVVQADFGYAYNKSFKISKTALDTMLKQADQAMYQMKNAKI